MPFREVVQEIASTAQRRAALTLSVALLVGIAAVLPYASAPLVPLPHISGMYGAAAAMINLATFWLLISSPSQPRSHSVIAAAYLYAGLMAVLHVMTFPGAVLPDRPLLGSPHAVSWLFIMWRAGFAGFIVWAALSAMQPGKEPRTFTYWPPLVATAAAVLAGFASQWTDTAATLDKGGGRPSAFSASTAPTARRSSRCWPVSSSGCAGSIGDPSSSGWSSCSQQKPVACG
ncbi:hypothetical protein ACQ86G_03950 [Roseateles chitinivorans]|uniref:hypothetical protein n=1 Tax=Roseateles chitinivorans TaxID=2917965 RepID=UPI003D6699EF